VVLSVPVGWGGGLGGAAREGIVVLGGQFRDALKVAKVIVFDKTGTLTKGNFKLDHIETVNLSEQDALKISAHIESFSNHPIAKAIVKSYDGILDQNRVHDVQEIAGRGLVGIYEGKRVLVGNDALMMDRGIGLTDAEYHGTRIYLAVDETLEAVFFINDQLKDQTKEGLAELRRLGIEKFVMLTGDRAPIADHIARELDIDEVHSELMPGDKLEILEGLLSEDHKVVFVGDGINDAPVLTRADVGIAMGRLGSDVAIESSDVVLMTDEITKVAEGIKVSRFTSHIIMQNIILALGIKIIIMILGTLGYANLWTAVFGDVGVAFIAILNSGRAIYNK
jgi:Cd2+/Zn2+-exporting ATPase